jgi:hypothetical protein
MDLLKELHGYMSYMVTSVKTPKPKNQDPEKLQAPNPKQFSGTRALEPGPWSLSGVWSLVFGAFIFGLAVSDR